MAMIPDLQAALLCDDVRQERSGKFILIGLFDRIGTRQFPFRYPKLCFFTRWCSGEGEFTQQTRLLRPDESVMALGREIPVRLKNGQQSATNVEVFMNVEIQGEGMHWVEVLLDGDLKLRFPLTVQQLQQPQQPGEEFPHG